MPEKVVGGRSGAQWQESSSLFGLHPKSPEDLGRYHLKVMRNSSVL